MTPSRPTFSPGFRLSATDVAVLVLGTVAAVAVARADGWIGIAVGFVVGHFFLFCNVLRAPRPLELAWAGGFAAAAFAATVWGVVPWPTVFAGSSAGTAVVAVLTARRPSYHGIGWRRLNPSLQAWWAARDGV